MSFPRRTETRPDENGDGGGARFKEKSRCGVARRSATACVRALGAPRGGVCAREAASLGLLERSVTPSLDEKSARFRFLTESAYKGLHVLNPEKEQSFRAPVNADGLPA